MSKLQNNQVAVSDSEPEIVVVKKKATRTKSDSSKDVKDSRDIREMQNISDEEVSSEEKPKVKKARKVKADVEDGEEAVKASKPVKAVKAVKAKSVKEPKAKSKTNESNVDDIVDIDEDEVKVEKKVKAPRSFGKKLNPKAKAAAPTPVQNDDGDDETAVDDAPVEKKKRHVMTPLERVDNIIATLNDFGFNQDVSTQLTRLRSQLDGAKIKSTTNKRAPNAFNLWMKDTMKEFADSDMKPKEKFAHCISLWNEKKAANANVAEQSARSITDSTQSSTPQTSRIHDDDNDDDEN